MADYDLVVLGGGPGGYVAAIRAAQLGLKTAVVEREHLGGVCLNWGCIPTKALLRSAEVFESFHNAAAFGLAADNVRFDMAAVVKRSRDAAKRLSQGVGFLLKKNKVDVVSGTGRLGPLKGGARTVTVDGGANMSARHVIVATGARARTIPQAGLAPDGDSIWTYKEAMVPKALPDSVIVIGSGAIGIEFASFYRAMGASVTVLEALDRILPAEDAEISAFVRKRLEKRGVAIHTGVSVEAVETRGGGVRAKLKDGASHDAEKMILAVGIVGNVEDIGLEAAGVEVDRGHVSVDPWLKTTAEGVYAIGDVAGAPWLAHKASHEGVVCVEKIAGQPNVHPMDVNQIPGCTYCHPQVASIGWTEAQAKAAGREIRVGRFPFVGNGKAIAMGEDQGLVKTIFDAKTGELLGAHMAGAEVTELIQGYAVAMACESTEAELMKTVFPHPTLSEMMHEAVLDAYGRVLHI